MKLYTIYEARLDRYSTKDDLSVLYHGTKRGHVKHILKYGLDPMKSIWADDEKANDQGQDTNGIPYGPPYHFIYLSQSPKTARDFSGNWGDSNQHPAILEIRLPPELQKKLVNRGEFVRAPFLIPPQYIKQISVREIDKRIAAIPKRLPIIFNVHHQDKEDAARKTPVDKLPIVFSGSLSQAGEFCNAQPGYKWCDRKVDCGIPIEYDYYVNAKKGTKLFFTRTN